MDLEYLHDKMKQSAKEFLQYVNENYVVFSESETVVWDKDIQRNKGELIFTDNKGEYDFDAVYSKFLNKKSWQ